MKPIHFTLVSIISLCCACMANAQQEAAKKEKGVTTDITVVVPPAVADSAQAAVQILGDRIKIGDFMYGFNTMYPRYKKRQEALHGAKKLRAQILEAKNQLNQMGVIIESFIAERPTGFFRVWPSLKPEIKAKLASGEISQTKPGDEYYHWMVIVPTTQVWKFLDQKGGPPRFLKREQFQIAIASETDQPGQMKWTFIGDVEVQQLRALFPSLPPNLLLPELKDSELIQLPNGTFKAAK